MISKYHIKINVCLKKLLDQKLMVTKFLSEQKKIDKKSFDGNFFFGWIDLESKKFGNKMLVEKIFVSKKFFDFKNVCAKELVVVE